MKSPIPLVPYNFIPTTYRQNTSVVFNELCNGFEVTNFGATLATVNGRPLYPGTPGVVEGSSYSVGGNLGEIFNGRVDIAFPAGGVGFVIFTQKVYIKEKLNDVSNG